MTNYNTIRLQKIKSIAQSEQAQSHNFRLHKKLSNVDYNKTCENIYLIGKQEDLALQFNLLKQQYNFKFDSQRQNMFTEFVISASPEFFKNKTKKEITDYFQKHIDFLNKEYFKVKGSIVSAVIHFDEKTPHMHLIACPLVSEQKEIKRGKDKGKFIEKIRLSHSELFGGTGGKIKLKELQDKTNQFLKENGFDLERGKSKEITKKSHKTTFEHLRHIEQKFDDYKNVKINKSDKNLIKEMQEEYKNQRLEHQTSMLSKLTKFSTIKLEQGKFKHFVEFCIKLINKNKALEQELKFKESEFKQRELELNNKENLLNKREINFEEYYKKAKYQIQQKVDELQNREIKFNSEQSNLKSKYEAKIKELKNEIQEYEETLNEITDVFNYKPKLEQVFYEVRNQMYQERENYLKEEQQNTNKTKYTY